MKKALVIILMASLIVGISIIYRYQDQVGYPLNAEQLSGDFDVLQNNYVEKVDKPLETYNITIPSRFIEVMSNGSLSLYLEPETLAIAVKVLDNGYVYSSYNFNDSFAGKSTGVVNPIKSGVTLDLFKDTTPVSITYLDTPQVLGSTKQPAATSTYTVEGDELIIHVDYNHPEIMIKFDISITLSGKTLSYYVPFDSIEEYNPNNFNNTKQYYLLRNIVLFPYFGSVKSKDDGYIVIPDGSGAIVTLDENPTNRTTFSASVYGSDRGYETLNRSERVRSVKDNQRISLPLYGVVHDAGNTGFLAYIDEGASYADINFKSAGVINDYYYTYFSYRYRRTYEQYQSRSNEDQFRISFSPEKHAYDLKQSIEFLSGDQADYVGIANAYQNVLIDKGILNESKRVAYDQVPLSVNVVGSDITQGIIQNKALKVTSYNQTKTLTERLINDGYDELIIRLMTYDMRSDQYEFSRTNAMGSRSDLKRLLAYFEDQDITFSQYYDYVRYYGSNMRYLAQSLSRRQISYRQTSYMFYTHQVVRPSFYESMVGNDIDELGRYDIHSVSIDNLNYGVFTGYDDGMVFRSENIKDIQSALSVYQQHDMTMDIYQPDDYLYGYVSSYLGSPLNSSNYKFLSATIPLVQLILSGYVDMFSEYINFFSDAQNMLLRMVEFGVFPSTILTNQSAYILKKSNMSSMYITEYDVLKNRIENSYNFIATGLQETIGQTMTDHQFISEGITKVTYSNGLEIVINYTNASYIYQGETILPLSYEVFL
jgi:hypothetical protein